MNSIDAMAVVLKYILLCFLGFRFINIVYVSWYYIYRRFKCVNIYRRFKCVTTTSIACVLACLSLLSACLSVKLQWVIQVTMEIQSNSRIQELSNNLYYGSSLSLSVSAKVIPKFLI